MLRFRGQNGVKTERRMQIPTIPLGQKMFHNPFEQHVSLKAVSGGACGLGLTYASGAMSVVI